LSLAQEILFNVPDSLKSSAIGDFWSLLGNLFYLFFYTWFYSRFFIPEVPLSIENNLRSAIGSIERSWLLSKGSVWKIALINLVSFLLTVPFFFLAFIAVFLVAAPSITRIYMAVETAPFSPFILTSMLLLALGAIIALSLTNIFMLPFWQILKAVVYYDLRSRREGLGIELRET
jgi:hypothetical protein